jgi:hypothetical protein
MSSLECFVFVDEGTQEWDVQLRFPGAAAALSDEERRR